MACKLFSAVTAWREHNRAFFTLIKHRVSIMFFQGYSFNATEQNNTGPSAVGTVIASQLPLTDSGAPITRNWCTRALFVYIAMTEKCLLLTCNKSFFFVLVMAIIIEKVDTKFIARFYVGNEIPTVREELEMRWAWPWSVLPSQYSQPQVRILIRRWSQYVHTEPKEQLNIAMPSCLVRMIRISDKLTQRGLNAY